nr:DNA/RNA non-specific endonuclease [uncultured Agathobaculum sp.]
MQRIMKKVVPVLLCIQLLLSGCAMLRPQQAVSLEDIPAYSGEPYVEIDGNVPDFAEEDRVAEFFESYAPLDSLGRCGTAYACISTDLMPTEERGSIGQVKPSGWQTVKYDFVDGKYLYNRCHLIGYQLTAENANEENLITGTRYFNVEGMLPFENMVADYIKETGNHVLYRVTPVFEGDNLVASGVQMEALSVEDEGDGICYNVYCYNVQPGVEIDYATGESREADAGQTDGAAETQEYVLNTASKKIHLPDCASVDSIGEKNKETYTGSYADLLAQGYTPCGNCLGK